jgi:hypothetical protein
MTEPTTNAIPPSTKRSSTISTAATTLRTGP